MPGTLPSIQASAGDVLTLNGKSGAGNTGYIASCNGAAPTTSTAEYTIFDTGTGGQVAKCINGWSESSANPFTAFFCRGTGGLAAFANSAGSFVNTYNWPATGLPIQYGKITNDPNYPALQNSNTTLMGACNKDGYAQWCSGCPTAYPNTTTQCDITCDWSPYDTRSADCNVPANGLSDSANQQTRNARAQFVPTSQGNYRIQDIACTSRGAGGTDTTPCAVNVQVGTAPPPPGNCQDLGGGLAADPTVSTYNNALNVFVLGNDAATNVEVQTGLERVGGRHEGRGVY